jgi:hypothetical protein
MHEGEDADDGLDCHAGPEPVYVRHDLEYADPRISLVCFGGAKEFPAYHRRHNRGLPLLVILPSLAAFASAVVLIFTGPARLPLWASLVVAALDLMIIMATLLREAPPHAQHDREGYQAPLIRQQGQGNWIRTVLWTANALFLLVWTAQLW